MVSRPKQDFLRRLSQADALASRDFSEDCQSKGPNVAMGQAHLPSVL